MSKTIVVDSVLPAGVEEIWARLLNIETLRYIARPMMTFVPVGQEGRDAVWIEGGSYTYKIRMWGMLPVGKEHRIRVKRMDREKCFIETQESNRMVPVWNHRIELEAAGEERSVYRDIVEIEAGWRTPAVAWWSKMFYRHRQRKWNRLLGEGEING